MKKRLIARLDIKKNQLIKGVHLEGLRRLGDPYEFAKRYYEEGIDEILLLDSVASLHGRNALGEVIKNLTENIFIPITVGGGVKSIEEARMLLMSGADKVTVNTGAVERPELIDELAKAFGQQAVVASLQVKKHMSGWKVLTHYGRELSDKDMISWMQELERRGAGEIMVTSIDYDGTNHGYDIDILKRTIMTLEIPFICSGGIGDEYQIAECLKLGASGVALASALHYGKESISRLKKKLRQENFDIRY